MRRFRGRPIAPPPAAAVSAGQRLETGVALSPLVLDTTTDSVISAFEDILLGIERVATDRVVRPSPEVLAMKSAAMTLRQVALPNGTTSFLDLSMPLQHKAMDSLVTVLTGDKTAVASVKTLGLGWAVAQIVAHLEPYGRMVRAADGRDLQSESVAFHDAFTTMAVVVSSRHAGDAEIHRRLFGAYDTELEAQQAEEREGRKRSAAKKKAEEHK